MIKQDITTNMHNLDNTIQYPRPSGQCRYDSVPNNVLFYSSNTKYKPFSSKFTDNFIFTKMKKV